MDSYLTELEYLRRFVTEIDFGPAHEDVVDLVDAKIEEDTGKKIPLEYRNPDWE